MPTERDAVAVEFGRRVRRRRRLLDFKQWEVAAKLQISRSHYTQLEGGVYQSLRFEQLAKLADILQTSADYLIQRVADDPGVIPPRRSPEEGFSWEGRTPLPVTTIPQGDCSYGEYSTPYIHLTLSPPTEKTGQEIAAP